MTRLHAYDAPASRGAQAPKPTSDIERVSEATSLALVSQNDAAIDLSSIKKGSVPIATAIRDGFRSTMSPLLASATMDDGMRALLEAMVERIAVLESDNFVLKTALANNNRFVMSEVARYTDPIVAMQAHASAAHRAERSTVRSARVPLGPKVLGQGWHAVETRSDGSFWRWSGPGKRSTLLLPGLGAGAYTIGWEFQVLDSSVLDGWTVAVNGSPAANVTIDWGNSRRGRATVQAEIGAEERSSFLFLEMCVGGTLSPASVDGTSDTRPLGIGIGEIGIELGNGH